MPSCTLGCGRGHRHAVRGRRLQCVHASIRKKPAISGSWGDKVAEGQAGEIDRLQDLGDAQQYNINVDHGQSSQYIDRLFTGNILGHKSDIASGELRIREFRTYNNIEGDYYIAQRFLHKIAMHMVKNYLWEKLRGVKVPLILGIWGPKGTGKTFQTELSFKKMNAKPIIMSAGELESGEAAAPGYLIRSRYRSAADFSKSNGVLSALMLNDIDAGLGRFDATQCTVNNQIVCSTLMNMCDDPTHVSIGEVWRAKAMNIRIPIFVTGNDFSTLYAPLIRDGRMDKFYWVPNIDEKLHMVYQMYKEDNFEMEHIAKLLQRFGNQTLDFFGAIRASTYDGQILQWIKSEVTSESLADASNLKCLHKRLLHKDEIPEFETRQVKLDDLMEEGDRLVHEHEMINNTRLSDEYMNKGKGDGSQLVGFG